MNTKSGWKVAVFSVLAVAVGMQIGSLRAYAEDSAEEILKTAMERYENRMKGIENYTVVQSMSGMKTTSYFERVETDDGRTHFRHVTSAGSMGMTAGDEMGGYMKQGGGETAGEMVDPYMMFDQIAARAELEGTEKVDGREAYLISVDDLSGMDFGAMTGMAEAGEGSGGGFQPKSMTIWLDKDRYVTLRTVMEGTVEMEGEATDVTFDIKTGDYRDTDGLLHPFHTEIAMEGMGGGLTAEQQAEMEKARREMEKQLQGMDEKQRAMVEKMMKDRMPDMESMMGPGPMTVTIEVEEVMVNEGPPESMAGRADRMKRPAKAEHEAEPGISPEQLTPEYMEGEWCTEGREPAIFRFYSDGSYHMALAEQLRVDTSGRPSDYQRFLDRFDDARIVEMTQNHFRVIRDSGETVWKRDCGDSD